MITLYPWGTWWNFCDDIRVTLHMNLSRVTKMWEPVGCPKTMPWKYFLGGFIGDKYAITTKQYILAYLTPSFTK
jgi:hypothetical protein